MSVVGVIPSRYRSTRLPGKPLLDKTGKPLIQYVYENAVRCTTLDRVIVATDDERIYKTAVRFGAEAQMTSSGHSTGTDRVAEIASRLEGEIFVNIQGDEPEIDPTFIDRAVNLLRGGDGDVSTLCSPIADAAELEDPNTVKCVVDDQGRALYFSRAPLPYRRSGDIPAVPPVEAVLKHHGLYCFRRDALLEFPRLTPPHIESAEQLEQLRLLWHGYKIAVCTVPSVPKGIDTPADYEAFVARVGLAPRG